VAFLAGIGAEPASVHAYIGIVQVAVDNVKRLPVMFFPPYMIGQASHTDKIFAFVKGEAVFEGESLTLQHLVVNSYELWIEKIWFHQKVSIALLSAYVLIVEGDSTVEKHHALEQTFDHPRRRLLLNTGNELTNMRVEGKKF
jgi:hypothetical protein